MENQITLAKRKCILCSGRRLLHARNDEKDAVQAILKGLYEHYNSKYNEFRKEDAPVEEIRRMQHNKTLSLDLLHECRSCNKEIDLVNRSLKPQ